MISLLLHLDRWDWAGIVATGLFLAGMPTALLVLVAVVAWTIWHQRRLNDRPWGGA